MSANTDSQTYPARFEWLDAVHSCKHLFPKTKNVAWALFSHADKETLFSYPNLSQIDSELGGPGSSRNASRHIKALERACFITVGMKMFRGHASSNYTLIPHPRNQAGEKWTCERGHSHLDLSDLYLSTPKSHPEGAPAFKKSSTGLASEGLTLSITPSNNTSTNTLIYEPKAHLLDSIEVEDSREKGTGSPLDLPSLIPASRRAAASTPPTAVIEAVDGIALRQEVSEPWWKRWEPKFKREQSPSENSEERDVSKPQAAA